MRLELGSRVECMDGTFGELADVVVDPTASRITHLVVDPLDEEWLARLVPIDLVDDRSGTLALRLTIADVRQLPPAREVAFLRLGDLPVDDPYWEVAVRDVLALPYTSTGELEPAAVDFALLYDRIPRGEVEIERGSAVFSADGHRLGQVDGFVVDRDDRVTHVVLGQRHVANRREIAIPVGAVARVDLDGVRLALTKGEVEALPRVDAC
jgi:hypothetical protein